MSITIILQTFFQEFSSGFSRGKVFLVSKKDCVAVQNTRIMENALNVRLNPLYSYLTLENVSERSENFTEHCLFIKDFLIHFFDTFLNIFSKYKIKEIIELAKIF